MCIIGEETTFEQEAARTKEDLDLTIEAIRSFEQDHPDVVRLHILFSTYKALLERKKKQAEELAIYRRLAGKEGK